MQVCILPASTIFLMYILHILVYIFLLYRLHILDVYVCSVYTKNMQYIQEEYIDVYVCSIYIKEYAVYTRIVPVYTAYS